MTEPVILGPCTLYCGEALDCLPLVQCADACVCDPPYGLKFMGKNWDHGIPGVPYWQAIMAACKPGAHLLAFGGTRTFHRLACAIEDAGWEIRDTLMWVYGSGFPKSHNLNGEHKGFGTALKPAWEPIILARKPLEGTVAENVQKHGCGALNIDGCRVDGMVTTNPLVRNVGGFGSDGLANQANPPTSVLSNGRWPANLIHDGSEEVLAGFPQTNGQIGGVNDPNGSFGYHGGASGKSIPGVKDSGSAARFFYCAKASKQDRDEGCEGLDSRKSGMSNGAQLHGDGYDKGQDIGLNRVIERRNHHPTVKPTALMRYLCKLVTPPGGLILDPFMGSGSTGKAAVLEGFRFIGIDKEAEYVKIAEARVRRELQQQTLSL